MKRLSVLFVGLLLAMVNCATTGTAATSRPQATVCTFEHTGTKESARKSIYLILVRNGFALANDDTSVGILVTSPKLLEPDERRDLSPVARAMLGTNVTDQKGVVSFTLVPKDSNVVVVDMTCRLEFGIDQQSSQSTDSSILPSHHPLPMKLCGLIRNAGNFRQTAPVIGE